MSSSHNCNISSYPTWHFYSLAEQPAQMSCATPQFYNAWISLSGSILQASHRLFAIIRFLDRFTRVGKILQQAHQPKTLILFGTLSFHKVFHTPPPITPPELSVQSNSIRVCRASRYLDLTEYSPDFSPIQSIISGIAL